MTEPAERIEAEIAKLIADANAAQKAYDTNAAYANAMDVVSALRAELANALKEIASECPDVSADFSGDSINADIDAMQSAIQKAYEDGTITEGYDELVAGADDIKAAIESLVAAAKAAQDAHRRAANQAAYEADIEIINGLKAQLQDALDEIADMGPLSSEFDLDAMVAAINTAIQAQIDQADNALADVEESGCYENTVDSASIEAMIQALLEAAEKAGVDNILSDVENEDIRIFTTEGVEVSALQEGKVNIVVYPNGKVRKVFK